MIDKNNYYLPERDTVNEFCNDFSKEVRKYKSSIKLIEETNVCYKGEKVLVPYITFFIKSPISDKDKKSLEVEFIEKYKKRFKVDEEPAINFLDSSLYVRPYKEKYYHLSIAPDARNRDFPEHNLYEITYENYIFLLDTNYSYCFNSNIDQKENLIGQFKEKDKIYIEIFKNGLSEKLLESVLSDE